MDLIGRHLTRILFMVDDLELDLDGIQLLVTDGLTVEAGGETASFPSQDAKERLSSLVGRRVTDAQVLELDAALTFDEGTVVRIPSRTAITSTEVVPPDDVDVLPPVVDTFLDWYLGRSSR